MNEPIKHYIYQRRTIGILIILLAPLSVICGLWGCNNPENWWHSISATFYANDNVIMIGIISIAAFFFCTYTGYNLADRIVNVISGIGLLGLLCFPCCDELLGISHTTPVGLFCIPPAVSQNVHLASTIVAFTGFFINIGFLFTKSAGEKTDGKKRRNILYRICSLLICPVCVIIVLLVNFKILPSYGAIIGEFVALTGCGVAWLVKGEAFSFMND